MQNVNSICLQIGFAFGKWCRSHAHHQQSSIKALRVVQDEQIIHKLLHFVRILFESFRPFNVHIVRIYSENYSVFASLLSTIFRQSCKYSGGVVHQMPENYTEKRKMMSYISHFMLQCDYQPSDYEPSLLHGNIWPIQPQPIQHCKYTKIFSVKPSILLFIYVIARLPHSAIISLDRIRAVSLIPWSTSNRYTFYSVRYLYGIS